jgi:FlaG/FlaF family flagellin (archaellin)
MVAITVAMAAVAYSLLTGMIGEQKKPTPAIEFVKSEADKTIIVATADIEANWDDITILFTNATSSASLLTPKTGPISAGDTIYLLTDQILRGKVTVVFTHIPSNSLLGTYTIDNV